MKNLNVHKCPSKDCRISRLYFMAFYSEEFKDFYKEFSAHHLAMVLESMDFLDLQEYGGDWYFKEKPGKRICRDTIRKTLAQWLKIMRAAFKNKGCFKKVHEIISVVAIPEEKEIA